MKIFDVRKAIVINYELYCLIFHVLINFFYDTFNQKFHSDDNVCKSGAPTTYIYELYSPLFSYIYKNLSIPFNILFYDCQKRFFMSFFTCLFLAFLFLLTFVVLFLCCFIFSSIVNIKEQNISYCIRNLFGQRIYSVNG